MSAVIPLPAFKTLIVSSDKGGAVSGLFEAKQLPSGHWMVPDDVPTVTFLRGIGLEISSPINRYYNWNDQTPFDVQRKTVEMLLHSRRAYVFSSMGVGKTRTPIWAFDYLRKTEIASRMLVVAPLSILAPVWARELLLVAPRLRTIVVHGTAEQRRKQLKAPHDVAIINFDGLKVVQKELLDNGYDVVTIDEASAYRNGRSDRSKAIQPLIRRARFAWAMTGTPTPRDPSDGHGLLRLLYPDHPAALSYVKFRDMVSTKVSQFKYAPKEDSAETLKRLLAPSVRFTLNDVMELPETVYVTRTVTLSAAQEELYKRLVAKYRAEQENITALNEAVLLVKLLQIAAGAVYTADRDVHRLDPGDRIEQVKELVEETDRHVIIFVPFLPLMDPLIEALRAMDGSPQVHVIHGGVPRAERDAAFYRFQQPLGPFSQKQIIVAQPSAMSHGLTLTNANVVIWYSPTNDLEVYQQANARIIRPGQTEKTIVAHLVGAKVEAATYRRLTAKEKTQGILLDLLAE